MPKITINPQRCKGCLLCVGVCPKGCIVLADTINDRGIQPVRYRGDGCIACGRCAIICPDCCIEVYKDEE